ALAACGGGAAPTQAPAQQPTEAAPAPTEPPAAEPTEEPTAVPTEASSEAPTEEAAGEEESQTTGGEEERAVYAGLDKDLSGVTIRMANIGGQPYEAMYESIKTFEEETGATVEIVFLG